MLCCIKQILNSLQSSKYFLLIYKVLGDAAV